MRNTRTTDLQIALQAQSSTYKHQKKGRAGKKQFMFRSGPSVVLSCCDERVCTAVTPRLLSLLISLLILVWDGLARCDFFCVGASSQKFQKFQKSKKVPEPIRLSSGGAVLAYSRCPCPCPCRWSHAWANRLFADNWHGIFI